MKPTNIFSAFVISALLFFSALASAAPEVAPSTVSAINAEVARITDMDRSNDFGQQVINWIAYGSVTPTWGQESLLSVISRAMNFIALAMMAWLAALGATTFVIQTANKGTPGGQVISSFWMPIRISTATILLIPLTSGFSSLQYGVITVAEKGNAAGNYIMGVGLDYLRNYGIYRSPIMISSRGAILEWIQMETCAQYVNTTTGTNTIVPNLVSKVAGDRYTTGFSYDRIEPEGSNAATAPRTGYCGAISASVEKEKRSANSFLTSSSMMGGFSGLDGVSAADAAPAKIHQAQIQMLVTIRPKIQSIASLILSDAGALKSLQEGGTSNQSTYEQAIKSLPGKIKEAGDMVTEAVAEANNLSQSAVAKAVNDIVQAKNGGADWAAQTKQAGWPALGTIFWQVNSTQSEINKLAATMALTTTSINVDEDLLKDARYKEVYLRAQTARKAAASNEQMSPGTFDISAIADAGSEGSGFADGVKNYIYDKISSPIKYMLFKNSDDDLILNLQYFGSAMGAFGETIYWVKVFGISTAKAAATSVKHMGDSLGNIPIIGTAATGTAVFLSELVNNVLKEVSGLLGYLVVALIIVGFTMGIVLPTIPVVQWFMGVISWMLFYIECLLVSPMWLAAHGTAEKEGWGSEHTRQGYMLMIGLFLNPVLRVAGFFAILVALKPIGIMVSWLFDYINGVVVSGFVYLFMIFGASAVVCIFAYSSLTRIFSLPSELFERGLRWVNGGQEVTGDSQGEKETRNNIAAFGGKGETAASRVVPSSGPANYATSAASGGAGGGAGAGAGAGAGTPPGPGN